MHERQIKASSPGGAGMELTFEAIGIDIPDGATGEIRVTCPKCSPERRKASERCMSVNVDEGVFYCHHCAFRGGLKSGIRNNGDPKAWKKAEWAAPPLLPATPIPDRVYRWFAARGIPAAVVDRNGIAFGDAYMPQVEGWVPCIQFPYRVDGRVVNVKFRDGKKHFRQVIGAQKIPFGLDDVKNAAEVIWVEGEMDKLAVEVAGFTNALSVPDGAPPPAAKQYATKFDFLDNAMEWLAGKSHIIAVDADEPGKRLEEELSRRLGRENCKRVVWPEGSKDANDVLMAYGPERVAECLCLAEAYPIAGLYRVHSFAGDAERLWEEGMQGGVSTGWGPVDQHYTVRPGEWTLVTGMPGHGKALALDTPLPTTAGWTTMGEVQVGDRLFDEKGHPCLVTRTTEVMLGRPCFEVEFSDGTVIVADADHQWLTRTDKARRSEYQAHKKKRIEPREIKPRGKDQSHLRTYPAVVTTAQIAATLFVENGKRANHGVRVAKALEMPLVNLLVDPYVLGAWLGDGTSSSASITTADSEILVEIAKHGVSVCARKNGTRGKAHIYGLGVAGYRKAKTQESLQAKLRTLGVLNNKHIPKEYLRASKEQRLALLQGLMDTDGSCTPYGLCEFCSTSKRLADDVYELIVSLGWQPKMCQGRAMLYGKDCGPRYRIQVTPNGPVFRLSRKSVRLQTKTFRRLDYRQIIACRPVPSVPVRCIEVDSQSHLYLAGQTMIPTHNSSWVDALLVSLAERFQWPIAVFSPENQPIHHHLAKLCEIKRGAPFRHGPTPRMTKEDVRETMQWLDEYFVFLLPPEEELTVGHLLEKATAAVRRHGVMGLVLDPWNEMDHSRPAGQTETEHVSASLSKIRRFARNHGVHVWLVAHPQKLQRDKNGNRPVPTPYDVSGSAHFYNKADNCITVYRDVLNGGQDVQIHVQKIRFREVGRVGVATLKFDRVTGRYFAF